MTTTLYNTSNNELRFTIAGELCSIAVGGSVQVDPAIVGILLKRGLPLSLQPITPKPVSKKARK